MKKKNLAAILKKQNKNLLVLNLDYPQVPRDYVLVKMKYSGICHTQLNEISGKLGKDRFIPHCMGHEGVGEILHIGLGVKKFKIGDKVVISWIKKKLSKKILPRNIPKKIKRALQVRLQIFYLKYLISILAERVRIAG